MSKVTLKQWITALKSGNYEHTATRLRDYDGYCALGVLADLIDPDGWEKDMYGQWRWHGNLNYIPYDVFNELGFEKEGFPFSQQRLARHNYNKPSHRSIGQAYENIISE